MKKEYGKALRKLFKQELATALPHVTVWKEKSTYIFPGESVYLLGDYELGKAYAILVPGAKEDKITVEIAWSKRGRFPELSVRPNDLMQSPESAEEFSIRLPCVVSGNDVFWAVSKPQYVDPLQEIMASMEKPTQEKAEAAIAPLVADSVQQIAKFGLPYVERYLGART